MGTLLAYLLFIAIVIVTIAVFTRGKARPNDTASSDDSYAQGYWDGYRALGEKVSAELEKDQVDNDKIAAFVAEGYGERSQAYVAEDANAKSTQAPTTMSIATPEEIIAQKGQASIRNSNLLLYMASFLIVAAGATFIGAAVADTLKLVGLGMVSLGFYVGGLYLYASNEKLRPAAVAFTGTGLALLPFFGIALNQYGGIEPTISWFVTSVIGTMLYYIAAIILRNQVISYLTMAFVLSFVASSVAVISLPVVWYFIAIIATSLLASCVAFLKPSWVPQSFSEPIERTGQIVTPFALVASLSVYGQLSIYGYEAIFALATAHYLVAWLQSRQEIYIDITRVIAHCGLLIVGWDIFHSAAGLGVSGIVLATGQIALSLYIQRKRQDKSSKQLVWIIIMMFLQGFAFLFWIGNVDWAIYVLAGLVIIGLTGAIAGYIYRLPAFGSVPLIVSVLAPIVYTQYYSDPALSVELQACVSATIAGVSAALYKYVAKHRSEAFHLLVASFYMAHILVAFLYLFVSHNNGSAAAILAVMILLGTVASWVYRQPGLLVISLAFLIALVARIWLLAGWDTDWIAFGTVAVSMGIYLIAGVLLLAYKDIVRYKMTFIAALIATVCAAFIGLVGGDTAHTVAGGTAIVFGGILLAFEADRIKRNNLMEGAFYVATLGLQYITVALWPEFTLMLYGNWWALSVLVAALLRTAYYPRLFIAMGIASFTSGVLALSEGGGYSLFFLVEHLVLLVIGVTSNRSWAIWWGIVASSLAVLYFLRDIAYLAFAFLGLLLIGFVVWRLTRQSTPHIDKTNIK